jgi:predicted aspartyl protease
MKMETAPKKSSRLNVTGGCFAAALVIGGFRAASLHASQPSLHDQLVAAGAQAKFPTKIDEDTTSISAHVDGTTMVNVYELSGDRDPKLVTGVDLFDLQAGLTKNVCGNASYRSAVTRGVTYRYEYQNKGRLIMAADVSSCPAPAAAAVTTARANSVQVVLDGNRALTPLTVGSRSIYATVDSGRSDMTVKQNIADKLVLAGEASEFGDTDVTLADGSVKRQRQIKISDVNIGGHAIHGAIAMVVPDGTMMLVGYNVLRQPTGKFAINTASSPLEFD